jgi:hypothetical protein
MRLVQLNLQRSYSGPSLRRWRRSPELTLPAREANPSTEPVNAEWDEAFLRVESYLRAHHIDSRLLLVQLTSEILAEARRIAAQELGTAPVTIAMRVAHARIGEWFVRALNEGDWADERFRARGRLALLMAKLPQTAPEKFLSPEPLDAGVAEKLRGAKLHPGPELSLTPMPPATLEFPIVEAAEEKWVTFSRSAFFRASALWLVFAGAMGAVCYLIR